MQTQQIENFMDGSIRDPKLYISYIGCKMNKI